VEFALVLPVFALMLFAAIEFGRAYYVLHLLTNASREGARMGALPDKLEADVQTVVNGFLSDTGLSAEETTIVVMDASGTERTNGLVDAQPGDHVHVTVGDDFDVLSGTMLPGFSGTVRLRGRCVFRHE
jgi:Flp pilus assembly protein TadG